MALLHPTVKATTHKKKKGSIETKARCSLFFFNSGVIPQRKLPLTLSPRLSFKKIIAPIGEK